MNPTLSSNNHAKEGHLVRPRIYYLIPSIVTCLSMLAGFYAILFCFAKQFDIVLALLLLALLADGLDGRIARLLKVQSNAGAQFDSFSDAVVFGVLPAIFVYQTGLYQLGLLGGLSAFFYLLCTTFRLIRFDNSLNCFIGLPCPPAATFLAIHCLLFNQFHLFGENSINHLCVLTVFLALMMVSTFKFPTLKHFSLRDWSGKLQASCLLVLVLSSFLYILQTIKPDFAEYFLPFSPIKILCVLGWCYIVTGPICALKQYLNRIKA